MPIFVSSEIWCFPFSSPHRGEIKSFNPNKGYGFVGCEVPDEKTSLLSDALFFLGFWSWFLMGLWMCCGCQTSIADSLGDTI